MEWNWKEFNREKNQFRSYYCSNCKQVKSCGTLTSWSSKWQSYCCSCYYQNEQEQAQECSSYQQVYQQKVREKKEQFQQLQLLRNYLGCQQCGSKEVDAYSLYENSQLVCWSCLVRKEGRASGAISLAEQSKWYKKYWGINLIEWLEKFSQLPVNKNCADKWKQDKNHLNNCQCLEVEAKEHYSLVSNNLTRYQEKLKKCECKKSEKTRTPYYDSANYGYTYCETCETRIVGAGKHGVIKNRNNPKFWGLEIKEKVLCLGCLGKFRERMPISKRYTFRKYVRRGY